jgi:hypothetical protein
MKQFMIYEHPTKGLKAVKVGWSWPAFFFGIFWMLYKTLWLLVAAIIGASIVVAMVIPADALMANIVANLGFLAFHLVVCAKGNGWYEDRLQSRGFAYRHMVEAKNVDQALAFYAQSCDAQGDGPSGGEGVDALSSSTLPNTGKPSGDGSDSLKA